MRKSRSLLVSALLASCALFAVSSEAREPSIAIGEVGVTVTPSKPELQHALRSLLDSELKAGKLERLGIKEPYVLSATLVKLDSVKSAAAVRATCVVSVVLRRKSESTLQAVINGRAIAEDSQADAARSSALSAAVHSAMRRVPDTIKAASH